MKVVKPNKQQTSDPRLKKEVLGWSITPEYVITFGAIFIVAVVVAHFTGSMFRNA